MPFTLMCWNVQRLTDNSEEHKWEVVNQWISQIKPDVLGLIEVGPNVKIDGYQLVDYVNTLNYSGGATQLCIAAYLKSGTEVASLGARSLRVKKKCEEYANQKRAQLKITLMYGNMHYSIYLMHANASKNGGIDAVSSAVSNIKITKAIYIGDFNYDLNNDQNMLKIKENESISVFQPLSADGKVKKTHKNGGLLDFAMCSEENIIQPKKIKCYANWRTIDHSPIAFTVS